MLAMLQKIELWGRFTMTHITSSLKNLKMSTSSPINVEEKRQPHEQPTTPKMF